MNSLITKTLQKKKFDVSLFKKRPNPITMFENQNAEK